MRSKVQKYGRNQRMIPPSIKEKLFECRKEKGRGEKNMKRLGEKLGEVKGKRKEQK